MKRGGEYQDSNCGLCKFTCQPNRNNVCPVEQWVKQKAECQNRKEQWETVLVVSYLIQTLAADSNISKSTPIDDIT